MTPAAPHLLHAPEDLDVAVQVADMAGGRLPPWHRHAGADYNPDAAAFGGLGEDFERRLEAAKREAAGLPPEDEAEDWDE